MRENLRGLRENLKHKIRTLDEVDDDGDDVDVVEFVEVPYEELPVPPDPAPEEGLDFKASEIENNKSISSRVPFEKIVTNLSQLKKTKEFSPFSVIIEAIVKT